MFGSCRFCSPVGNCVLRPTNAFRAFSWGYKSGLSAFAVLAVLATVPADAQANARTCERLAAKLNSGGNGSNRYANAVVEQSRQLAKMKRVMRSNSCSSRPSLFNRDGNRACPRLRTTMAKMQKNLKRLQRSASRSSGRVSKRERRRIRRAMRRAGCEFKGRRSIAEQVFGNQNRKTKASPKMDERTRTVSLTGRMRTMCVRTCDGYYFPVSFSTRKTSLEKDTEACANMCPGTDTQLFVQPIGNAEPKAMVSTVDGTPYESLPTAFAFKERFDRSCVCNHRTVRREATDLPLMSVRPKGQTGGLAKRPDPARFPSWRDGTPAYPTPKRSQHDQPLQVAQDDTIIPADENTLSNRRVRIIGDAFLPTR
ncbi:MAG: DUF2865 domain-containing protein [Pseudomonadota bacterium]